MPGDDLEKRLHRLERKIASIYELLMGVVAAAVIFGGWYGIHDRDWGSSWETIADFGWFIAVILAARRMEQQFRDA